MSDDFNIPSPDTGEVVPGSLAAREEESYERELDLKDEKTNNRIQALKAKTKVRDIVTLLIGAFMILAFLLLAIAVTTLVLHFVLPEYCRWLSTEELTRLKDFIFSGAVGAVLATISKETFKAEQNA